MPLAAATETKQAIINVNEGLEIASSIRQINSDLI